MLFSRNDFFKQERSVLMDKRERLVSVLLDFNVMDIDRFLLAYDYFVEFPEDFDGATIVKDLDTIYNLDAPAMVHDFEYLINQVWKSPVKKFKADIQYSKDMERTGKHPVIAYFRGFLLIISTPIYYLLKIFK